MSGVGVLQQYAYNLHTQQVTQPALRHSFYDGRVILYAPFARTQRAQHIGIHHKAMTAIDVEEHRFGKEPLLNLLLYAFACCHSVLMNCSTFL